MANIESKHFLTLNLGDELKSDFACEPTSPISYGETFSLHNLPLPEARRRRATVRQAVAHELVYRCLEAKKLALTDVLPVIEKMNDTGEWERDNEHPALIALRNPNESQTWSDFFTSLVIDEDVWGRYYIEKIRSRAGLVVAMRVLDVRGVREIGENGQVYAFDPYGYDWTIPYQKITGYEVTEGGLAPRRIRKENIIAVRNFDIRSPLAGLSGVFVALDAVGMAASYRQYVDTYLRAGGPTGLIKVKRRMLTDVEAEEISDRFGRRYQLGSPDHGKPAVMDEDGDYMPIGSDLDKLDNSALNEQEQAKICSALGVPGQIVEAFYSIRWGNQRAGQETAQQKFWENTLSPTLSRYRQILDKFFLTDFEPKQIAGIKKRCFWDVSSVKALQEDVQKVAERSRSNYTAGIISLNEARTKQGFKAVAGGDEIQALVKEEAAKVALEQQKNPQPEQKPNAQGNKFPQKKSEELKRDETDLETEQVPAVREAQDKSKEKLAALLLLIKASLVQQGIEKLRGLKDQFAQLSLELTPGDQLTLKTAIADAMTLGARTINPDASPADVSHTAVIKIFTALSGALVAGVAGRMISAYALNSMRGETEQRIFDNLILALDSESSAFYVALASGAAFQAVGAGRHEEATKRGYLRAYYSAILDKNLCDNCRADDGKWSDNAEDLPPVPNPYCKGNWNCRCIWVYVFAEA